MLKSHYREGHEFVSNYKLAVLSWESHLTSQSIMDFRLKMKELNKKGRPRRERKETG